MSDTPPPWRSGVKNKFVLAILRHFPLQMAKKIEKIDLEYFAPAFTPLAYGPKRLVWSRGRVPVEAIPCQYGVL